MKHFAKICLALLLLEQLWLVSPAWALEEVIVASKYKQDTTLAPDPTYPILARNRRHRGQGVYRLIINDKTGIVDQVQVMKPTGSKELDAEAVMTLFKWTFRPGIKQREVAIVFETGRGNNLH